MAKHKTSAAAAAAKTFRHRPNTGKGLVRVSGWPHDHTTVYMGGGGSKQKVAW
jgi:hypothetical protein